MNIRFLLILALLMLVPKGALAQSLKCGEDIETVIALVDRADPSFGNIDEAIQFSREEISRFVIDEPYYSAEIISTLAVIEEARLVVFDVLQTLSKLDSGAVVAMLHELGGNAQVAAIVATLVTVSELEISEYLRQSYDRTVEDAFRARFDETTDDLITVICVIEFDTEIFTEPLPASPS